MNLFSKALTTTITTIALLATAGSVSADKLDDVIDEGVLRCGVVLDFNESISLINIRENSYLRLCFIDAAKRQ